MPIFKISQRRNLIDLSETDKSKIRKEKRIYIIIKRMSMIQQMFKFEKSTVSVINNRCIMSELLGASKMEVPENDLKR